MSRNPERNDRKSGKKPAFGDKSAGRSGGPAGGSKGPSAGGPDRGGWNPNPKPKAFSDSAPRPSRAHGRLLATADRAAELERDQLTHGHRIEIVEAQAIDRMLPPGAVHQGLAFKVQPLEGVALEDIAEPAEGVIVMLDQLTDPQNVGAIFRSALAFGARGIVVQDRHSPALAGALAKASAGATERLPCARVTNLSRALEKLADLGWRAVGLDGAAELTLDQALDGRPTVLVMGSEGDGVRRLVAEHCDVMARIPMPGGFESLNVSNAAAVALYEARRKQG